ESPHAAGAALDLPEPCSPAPTTPRVSLLACDLRQNLETGTMGSVPELTAHESRGGPPVERTAAHAVAVAFQQGLAAHRAGDFQTAENIYRDILAAQPDHAGALHFLGLIYSARGDHTAALELIERSLRFCGTKAVYWNNYGAVLKKMGRPAEARAAFGRAIALRPEYADAWSNLGLIHLEQGEWEEAESCLRHALRLAPRHADALRHLARVAHAKGETEEAVRLCHDSLAAAPQQVETLTQLGEIYCGAKRFAEAAEAFRRVIAARPDSADAHLNLGLVYNDLGEEERAREEFRTAAGLRPDKPIWRLRELSLCPTVFDSAEAILQYRAELERRLDEALAESPPLDWRRAFRDGFVPSFHLYHHGVCNRRLREKFARLFAPAFPKQLPTRGPRRARIRVGFLATYGHHGGFLRGFGGIMERLDRRRFEVVGLVSSAALRECRPAVHAGDILWIAFPHEMESAFRAIRGAECDILLHWQAGTDIVNYFLPFLPLAPVQCIGFGQHGTTGIANIDYFLSSRLFERGPEAREDYTERLVLFEGTTAWQPRPDLPPPSKREDFGLPAHGAIYFCPHRPAKFHPDFDLLLRRILGEDPGGHLVVLEGSRPATAARLKARWQRTLGEPLLRRVLFLPSQPPRDYYRLLRLADAVLDAPCYSASLTGYDAFALGVPVVTLPGPYMVQRYAAGLYRRMGVEDLVAGDEQQYVALAVRLGRDGDFRQAMREKILQRCGVLYEDEQVLREFEAFFRRAIEDAP
ncbi:O-linked N-acetylglucosamine transferase, SPINDLY family protein, partial [Thermopirellula anaerolimosa]